MNYNFEWDPNKAKLNREKHKVNFEEAATIFHDPIALTIYDPDHSKAEDRWLTIGISKNGKLLVTCHTYKQEDKKSVNIRTFSSRKATSFERKQYGG